jgi:hypothetical protein
LPEEIAGFRIDFLLYIYLAVGTAGILVWRKLVSEKSGS